MAKINRIGAFAGMVVAVLIGFGIPSQKVAAAHGSGDIGSQLGSTTRSTLNMAHPDGLGDYAFSLSVGDFNADGKLDLVVANGSNPGAVEHIPVEWRRHFPINWAIRFGGDDPVSMSSQTLTMMESLIWQCQTIVAAIVLKASSACYWEMATGRSGRFRPTTRARLPGR